MIDFNLNKMLKMLSLTCIISIMLFTLAIYLVEGCIDINKWYYIGILIGNAYIWGLK